MSLDFDKLRAANVTRCGGAFHPIESWSLTDWACAATLAQREAANVTKKLCRLEHDLATGHAKADEAQLKADLAHELADTVIYLDLWAARAGIDLGEAVRTKFNILSAKRRSDVRL